MRWVWVGGWSALPPVAITGFPKYGPVHPGRCWHAPSSGVPAGAETALSRSLKGRAGMALRSLRGL